MERKYLFWNINKLQLKLMISKTNILKRTIHLSQIGFLFSQDITKQGATIGTVAKLQQNLKNLNSFKPSSSEFYAFGHFFPKEWSQQKMFKAFDPTKRNIESFQIIKNKVGQATGKVMIKFKNEQQMNKYIAKYNEDYVVTDEQVQRIVILPYQLKTQEEKREKRKDLNLRYPARVSNMDFDIDETELRKLANDYGKVAHVDIPMRLNGINRGFATVYFDKKSEALSFINFIDGFLYKDRKLTAHFIEKPQKKWREQIQEKYLDMPTYTFKANEALLNSLIKKKGNNSNSLSIVDN